MEIKSRTVVVWLTRIRYLLAVTMFATGFAYGAKSDKYMLYLLFAGLLSILAGIFIKTRSLLNSPRELMSLINSETMVLAGAFIGMGYVQERIMENKNNWFYFFMIFDLAIMFLSMKKFRQPPAAHLPLTRLYGLITYLWLLYLCYTQTDQYFWITIVLGILAYLDNILVLYLMPFYDLKVKWAFHAWKKRKEYLKVYGKR